MAKLDLTAFDTTAKVVAAFDVWERLHGRIDRREMPPRGMPQPTDAERRMIGEWFTAVQEREAERHAGDPGVVLARRLSNAEYNYTIHDLTGVDIAPTANLPGRSRQRGRVRQLRRNACHLAGAADEVPRRRSQRRRSHRLSAARVHVRATRGGDGSGSRPLRRQPDHGLLPATATGSRRLLPGAVALREPVGARARRAHRSSRLRRRGACRCATSSGLRQLLQDRTGAFGPVAGLQQRWDAHAGGADTSG